MSKLARTSSVSSLDVGAGHAEERLVGGDLALARLQVVDDRPGDVDGDREAEVLGIGDDGRVHPHDLTGRVDERPAGVAGVDGGVGLDQALQRDPLGGEVAILGRHDPAGDGGLAAEVERVADGDHLVTDLEVVGGAELRRHQVLVDALHLDQGDVVVGRGADQRGCVLAAVGEHHGDVADAADHVGVGEHEPVGADARCRTRRPRRCPPRWCRSS